MTKICCSRLSADLLLYRRYRIRNNRLFLIAFTCLLSLAFSSIFKAIHYYRRYCYY